MIYTSKRRKFKDFVRTNNWHYYIIFLLIFATLVASIVIITRKNQNDKNNPTNNTSDVLSNTTDETTDNNSNNIRGRYKLDINIAINQISIYEWNNDTESYNSNACKYMPVAADERVAAGDYSFTSDNVTKETWYTTAEGKHYRYATNFNENISFHSAEFSSYNDKDSLVPDSYNYIGTSNSSDGFLLLCSDAKWIYENCSFASEVTIYSDDSEVVSAEITKVISLAPCLNWDPTDISSSSPYSPTSIKELKCLYNTVTVEPGTDVANLYKYVKAIDTNDNNISSYIYTNLNGKLDEVKSYSLIFYIADIFGNIQNDELIVIVEEPEPPTEEETTEDESSENESDVSEEPSSEEVSEEASDEDTTTSPEVPIEESSADSELSNLDN